jgi:hypothetical protein
VNPRIRDAYSISFGQVHVGDTIANVRDVTRQLIRVFPFWRYFRPTNEQPARGFRVQPGFAQELRVEESDRQ